MATPNPFPLSIEGKVNNPHIQALLEQFGHDKYVNAEDVNKIIQALNFLHENINGDGGSVYLTYAEYLEDVLIRLEDKQPILTDAIFGSFISSLDVKNTLIDSDLVASRNAITGKAVKTSWLNVWLNNLKSKVLSEIASALFAFKVAEVDTKIPLSQKAAVNGVATLGPDTKVPAAQLKFGDVAGTITEGNDSRLVEAFRKKINAISVTGDSNKTITLTREDGTTLTATFLDNDTEYPDDVINTLSFNANNDGVLIAITSEGEVLSVSLDGRYSLLGHTHAISSITGLQAFIDSLPSTYEPKNINTGGVLPKTKVGGVGTQDSALSETETDINSAKKIKGFKAFFMSIAENGFTGLFANGEEGTSGFVNGVMSKWRTKFYDSLFDFSIYRNDSADLVKAEILFENIMKFRFEKTGDFHAVRNGIFSGSLSSQGLQYSKGLDISFVNLNDLKIAGFYKGGELINSPTTGWFYVDVKAHNDVWISQTAKSMGSGNIGNIVYERTLSAIDGWTLWKTIIDNVSLDAALLYFETQIDLNYVRKYGNDTIYDVKTFDKPVKAANALEEDELVTLQQLNEESATALNGIDTEWINIEHTLPASFVDVVLRYKIKNSIYILDFKATCTGSGVAGSVTDQLIATLPNVDSEKLKVIMLDYTYSGDNGNGINRMMLVSSGEQDTDVGLYFTFRDNVPYEEEVRAALPITDFNNV